MRASSASTRGRCTGYGVIDCAGGTLTIVAQGCIATSGGPLADRLRIIHAQQLLDHVRDLRLLGTADAHDGELDRARRVFMNADRDRNRRERGTARLA